jgi:hypothetical protein
MSAALELMPRSDWATATIVTVPAAAPADSLTWARAIFDVRSVPVWAKALYGVREALVRVLGIPPGEQSMLAVDHVQDGEAIIDTDDVHLHFVAGVRVEPERVTVTTAVTLKGWRGRVYFVPVRLLHDAITRAMIDAAARRLA